MDFPLSAIALAVSLLAAVGLFVVPRRIMLAALEREYRSIMETEAKRLLRQADSDYSTANLAISGLIEEAGNMLETVERKRRQTAARTRRDREPEPEPGAIEAGATVEDQLAAVRAGLAARGL